MNRRSFMRLLGLTPVYAVGAAALLKFSRASAVHWDNAGATYINYANGTAAQIKYRWVLEKNFLSYLKTGWHFSAGPNTAAGFLRHPALQDYGGGRWAMMEIKLYES